LNSQNPAPDEPKDAKEIVTNTININLAEIINDIAEQEDKIEYINQSIPTEISLGFILVTCANVKKEMLSKRERIKEKLIMILYMILKFQIEELKKIKLKIDLTLRVTPKDIRELAHLKKYIDEVPDLLQDLN